jgi:hypothetical protein
MYTKNKYYNLFNLNNSQINEKILNINDDNSFKEVIVEIQNNIINNVPFIGIGFEKGTILTNNNLLGLTGQSKNYEKIGEVCRKTTEQFVEEARVVHGNKYDYSKTNYVNNRTNIVITCLTHGDFLQNPQGHLSGYGCPKCMLKEQNKIFDFVKSEFPEYI